MEQVILVGSSENTILKVHPGVMKKNTYRCLFIRYLANVKTPPLVLHFDEDHRCSLEQAEHLHTTLKVLGVYTRLVISLGEHHGLSVAGKPRNREERINLVVDWFEKYL